MKVLWFTLTPSLYKLDAHHYQGGGWIESLESLIREENNIELAVSFFHPTDQGKVIKNDGSIYYPICRPKERKSPIQSVIKNFKGEISEEKYIPVLLDVINDFKPDVIQIFGTESVFAGVQKYTNTPIIVHLQGLINPCLNAYFPPLVNKWSFLFQRKYFLNNLIGKSPFFGVKKFANQALREKENFKHMKYVIGRTDWDKKVTNLLAPNAGYFHGDEVLRSVFYSEAELRKTNKESTIKIVSTISPTIYKGIDVILKTAYILRTQTDLDFEWKIIGLMQNDKMLKFFERLTRISHKDNNISCLGIKNAQELKKILQHSDIYIHPSYIDNSPNSICEAQMIGLPVIACSVGGVPSLIEEGVTGKLVPSNGVYEIVSNLQEYAKHPENFLAIGKEAQLKAVERHDKNKIVNELIGIYKTISM